MIQIPVFNEAGSQVGSEQIDEKLLGGEVNARLLKQALVQYHANQRQGDSSQLRRGEVEGSTRKLYKQKGTGRARRGPIRTPIMKGGGRAFANKPMSYRQEMPRKQRRLARNNAVLAKVQGNAVLILDTPAFDQPKTKRFATMLRKLDITKGCVLATNGVEPTLHKSGRNIPRTEIVNVADLNALSILSRPKLVFTRAAFDAFRNTVAAAK
ncbi:MAG: 50S ribosomal protein L4 [Phycisphaerales bacterium]|nr:50S ribosomal protein L4 [Phycisphaerales bacterium]